MLDYLLGGEYTDGTAELQVWEDKYIHRQLQCFKEASCTTNNNNNSNNGTVE